MVIEREILWRLARIRFVITGLKTGGAKLLDENVGQTLVGVPKNSHLPWPRFTVQHRRETVHGYEYWWWSDRLESVDLLFDGIVVRPVNRLGASFHVGPAKVSIAGHDNSVTKLEKRTGIKQLPITIDDQPRILGQHGRDAQAIGQVLG